MSSLHNVDQSLRCRSTTFNFVNYAMEWFPTITNTLLSDLLLFLQFLPPASHSFSVFIKTPRIVVDVLLLHCIRVQCSEFYSISLTLWLPTKMLFAFCLNKVSVFIMPLYKIHTMCSVSKRRQCVLLTQSKRNQASDL